MAALLALHNVSACSVLVSEALLGRLAYRVARGVLTSFKNITCNPALIINCLLFWGMYCP